MTSMTALPSEHSHPIQKAINPVVKTFIIQKAFEAPDGEGTIIEGWTRPKTATSKRTWCLPKPSRASLDEYMARKGPLSSEHDTKGYPIGHAQRLALVRDGKIFKSATHPDDPAEFEHFPSSGTGMYGRYIITDPTAAHAVKKGNVGGFSWIGNLKSLRTTSWWWQALPPGRPAAREHSCRLPNQFEGRPYGGQGVPSGSRSR